MKDIEIAARELSRHLGSGMRGKGGEEQTGRHRVESHVEKEQTGSGLTNSKKEGMKTRRSERPAKTMAKIELVEDEVRGQARVRTIDKLDEACTNADDRMMRMQHISGDHIMRGFKRIF